MQTSLNETQLKELEELAYHFFTVKEIAVIMELDPSKLSYDVKDCQSPAYAAFNRGSLRSEYDLRKSILSLAKAGSSPAQTMAMDLLNKSKLKRIDR